MHMYLPFTNTGKNQFWIKRIHRHWHSGQRHCAFPTSYTRHHSKRIPACGALYTENTIPGLLILFPSMDIFKIFLWFHLSSLSALQLSPSWHGRGLQKVHVFCNFPLKASIACHTITGNSLCNINGCIYVCHLNETCFLLPTIVF